MNEWEPLARVANSLFIYLFYSFIFFLVIALEFAIYIYS